LIVDYAGNKGDALFSAICNLGSRVAALGKRIRLLLLDRPGRLAPGSMESITDRESYESRRLTARRFLFGRRDEEHRSDDEDFIMERFKISFDPLAWPDEFLRLDVVPHQRWRPLLDRMLAGTETPLKDDNDTEWWDRVARVTGNGRMLFLQIIAACFARDPELVSGLSTDDGMQTLLRRMLQHERETRWLSLFPSQTRVSDAVFRSVERAVGFVTLMRGLRLPDQEKPLLACVGHSAINTINEILPKILRFSRAIESTESPLDFARLEPDMLGEMLLLDLANDASTGLFSTPDYDPVQTRHWVHLGLLADIAHLAETISMTVADFPRNPVSQRWLQALLERFADGSADEFVARHSPDDEFLPDYSVGLKCCEAFAALLKMDVDDCDASLAQVFYDLCVERVDFWLGTLFTFQNVDPALDTRFERWHRILFSVREVGDRDIDLRLNHGCALAAADAISYYAKQGRFDEMASWGDRLLSIGEDARYRDSLPIQQTVATGAANAVHCCAKSGRFDDVEEWGRQLLTIAKTLRWEDNQPLQSLVMSAAMATMYAYGKQGRFANLEAWGTHLLGVAARRHWQADVYIQSTLAAAAANAMGAYANEDSNSDLERWGRTLRNVAEKVHWCHASECLSTKPGLRLRLRAPATPPPKKTNQYPAPRRNHCSCYTLRLRRW